MDHCFYHEKYNLRFAESGAHRGSDVPVRCNVLAAPYGSGITVGQENWSSAFTIAGLVFSGASMLLLVCGQTQKTLISTFRLIIPLVPAGIFLAFATGWVTTDYGVNPGGITATNNGFPFTWKVEQSSCPPPCVQVNGTIYNPLFFALDSLFFILVGYVLLREYRRRGRTVRGPLEPSGSSS